MSWNDDDGDDDGDDDDDSAAGPCPRPLSYHPTNKA
jgi:hypothetical protein